jgi:rhodanese-related sulfurtransferase
LSDDLCWKSVRSFGDDDPEDEIRNGADAGEQSYERCDDADEVDVPTVVECEAGADSGDHAVVAWTRELVGVGVDAWWRRRSGGDGGSAGGAEAGGWVDWFAALSTEHVGLRRLYFAIERRWRWGKEEGLYRVWVAFRWNEEREVQKADPLRG